MKLFIGVIGPASADSKTEMLAYKVGRLIAQRNAILVCGGLGGVMEAACRGSKSEGGTTLGILPGNSKSAANEYVDIAVPTGMGEARNVIVVNSSDGILAIGGGLGTLSEIALALRSEIPVVGVKTWRAELEGMAYSVETASGPEHAVDAILAKIRERAD